MKKKISVKCMNLRGFKRHSRWIMTGALSLALTMLFGCAGSTSPGPVQVETKSPEVSYQFTTDEDLIEANSRARTYCSQYASTPMMEGTIINNQDGTKTVTYECIQSPTKAPAASPESYTYRTDNDLLMGMQSAEAYCAQQGRVASFNVTTNASGTQTLSYRCVPR